jgi:hypothetical protein
VIHYFCPPQPFSALPFLPLANPHAFEQLRIVPVFVEIGAAGAVG